MKAICATAVVAVSLLLLSSCGADSSGHGPVKPAAESSTQPWNSPVPGQGGGALSGVPQTPRR